MLILLSGLPGVGKSAIADALGRQLGAPVLSVDPIEAAIWRCGIAPSFETGVAAYEVAATLAAHQLALGLDAIGDAVNSMEVGRDVWRAAARRVGAQWRVIHVVCSDVEAHRRRLAARQRDITAFPEPTWEEVEKRMQEFEPWPEPTLLLDSVTDLDVNLEKAMSFVTASE